MRLCLFAILFCATLSAQEPFDGQSRIVPKKQIYNQPVKKIFFYAYFIQARYGKRFHNPEIQAEFENQPWYKVNPLYHDSLLNGIDIQNIRNLTSIYDSLSRRIRQLKNLKSRLVWTKRVGFIENDTTQTCRFAVIKIRDGFRVEVQFRNKAGVFYSDKYSVAFGDFGNEWGGYPTDGVYEAIARNFEFINLEFFPDARVEPSMVSWYQENRLMPEKEAQLKFEQFKTRSPEFGGEVYFTGYRHETIFPREYVYLGEERSFVLVYSP